MYINKVGAAGRRCLGWLSCWLINSFYHQTFYFCCFEFIFYTFIYLGQNPCQQILLNLVDQPEWDPHQCGTVILFWRSCYLTTTNLRTMRKWRWAQIPQNGLKPWNLRWDPCMRTKFGLWLTCPLISEPLRLNGYSRGRRMLIVVLLSTKLELSQKGFWQVQGVDYDEFLTRI